MKLRNLIVYALVIIPVLLLMAAAPFITKYYGEKITNYFESKTSLIVKKQNEQIDSNKTKSKQWIDERSELFDYKYSRVDEDIKKELQQRIELAYNSANLIHKKYSGKKSEREIQEQIINLLKKFVFDAQDNYIFINNYKGNSILASKQQSDTKNLATYSDADYRSIVLEEIQKVRKRGQGFLESNTDNQGTKRIIFVKNLGMYDWFIGSSILVAQEHSFLKTKFLEAIKSAPVEENDFVMVFDANTTLYKSPKTEMNFDERAVKSIRKNLSKKSRWHVDTSGQYLYYTHYYEPLNWYLVYGFSKPYIDAQELQKQEALEKSVKNELVLATSTLNATLIIAALFSILLVMVLALVFRRYEQEIQSRDDEINKLNDYLQKLSLEEMEIIRSQTIIQENSYGELSMSKSEQRSSIRREN